MFGMGKKEPSSDELSVQVHAVTSDDAFKLAQKIWNENGRTIHVDPRSGKEFLHFAYANPKCVVWLQHDQGRTGILEMIVRWEADQTHEVFVLATGQQAGDDTRAKALLNSMLTTPSVVISNQ